MLQSIEMLATVANIKKINRNSFPLFISPSCFHFSCALFTILIEMRSIWMTITCKNAFFGYLFRCWIVTSDDDQQSNTHNMRFSARFPLSTLFATTTWQFFLMHFGSDREEKRRISFILTFIFFYYLLRRRILFICGWKWEKRRRREREEKFGNNNTNRWTIDTKREKGLVVTTFELELIVAQQHEHTVDRRHNFSAREFYCSCTKCNSQTHTYTRFFNRSDYASQQRRYPFCLQWSLFKSNQKVTRFHNGRWVHEKEVKKSLTECTPFNTTESQW